MSQSAAAIRCGKRPLETDAWNQHNKKLRVGDVCLGVFGGETTFVKLLQPVDEHEAFSVLVLGQVSESSSRRHVPVASLRPLPETTGQSVQLQTPTKMYLESTPRGPCAQNTPVAVPVTVLRYCNRQLAVEFHGLEFEVPFERLLSEPSVLTDSSANRSRMLALVTSRPRLVTAAVVVGGLGFLANWHAASAVLPEVSLPRPPGHPPFPLGLLRCSSSCTSHLLGSVRAIVAKALPHARTLLGLLTSGCAQLLLPTHDCMPDPPSLRRFYQALYNLHSVWWYGFNSALLYLGEVVLYGALASWDLNALAVLGLIVANALAYKPLHNKQRQNLRSVGLRADNFSPARVLSACFAHADEKHLLNNVLKKAVSNPSEYRALPPRSAQQSTHPPLLRQLVVLTCDGVRLHRELSCSNILVLAFYAAAGFAGASASAFLGPRQTYTVGASGAICGLKMATLALAGMHSAHEARAPPRAPHGPCPAALTLYQQACSSASHRAPSSATDGTSLCSRRAAVRVTRAMGRRRDPHLAHRRRLARARGRRPRRLRPRFCAQVLAHGLSSQGQDDRSRAPAHRACAEPRPTPAHPAPSRHLPPGRAAAAALLVAHHRAPHLQARLPRPQGQASHELQPAARRRRGLRSLRPLAGGGRVHMRAGGVA